MKPKIKNLSFYDLIKNEIGKADAAIDHIQCRILDFCGCGQVGDNLNFILAGLEYIYELTKKRGFDEGWSVDWIKRGTELFGSDEMKYFFFYWTDKEEFSEHGSCIPGWLTQKGITLMEDLQIMRGLGWLD